MLIEDGLVKCQKSDVWFTTCLWVWGGRGVQLRLNGGSGFELLFKLVLVVGLFAGFEG